MKDMNGQLLSMVGIFTALAFLLFGGISSLESIFQNVTRIPLLSLSIISTIWVLGLLNVIFVFLYCVGKMTKLNFREIDDQGASFWQRYPVICWVDFWMLILLCLLSWTYLLYNHRAFIKCYKSIQSSPLMWGIIGYGVIVILAGVIMYFMKNKPKSSLS